MSVVSSLRIGLWTLSRSTGAEQLRGPCRFLSWDRCPASSFPRQAQRPPLQLREHTAYPLDHPRNAHCTCFTSYFRNLSTRNQQSIKQDIMAAAIPPGGTFFDTLKRSFVDVPVAGDDKISTSEFLEAVEGVMGLFGMFIRMRSGVWMGRLTRACRRVGFGGFQAREE
jgi:hypothetical protein